MHPSKTSTLIFTLFTLVGLSLTLFAALVTINEYRRGNHDALQGGLVVVGLGTVFLLIGGISLFVMSANKRKKEQLKASGVPIQGTILDVIQNTAISINGRSPYQIIATWTDPNGETREGRSQNFWDNPRPYLPKNEGEFSSNTITIYIDPNKPTRYVFDESFMKRSPTKAGHF